jgi:hypothetical protein
LPVPPQHIPNPLDGFGGANGTAPRMGTCGKNNIWLVNLTFSNDLGNQVNTTFHRKFSKPILDNLLSCYKKA